MAESYYLTLSVLPVIHIEKGKTCIQILCSWKCKLFAICLLVVHCKQTKPYNTIQASHLSFKSILRFNNLHVCFDQGSHDFDLICMVY